MLHDAEKMVQETIDPNFSLDAIPQDDKEVFEMLSTGDAYGVFQFESNGMRQVLAQIKPTGIEEYDRGYLSLPPRADGLHPNLYPQPP